MSGQAWTDERVETAKTLWAQGYSASQIAARLGRPHVTRNAVVGKLHRLGLARDTSGPKPNRRATRCPRAPRSTGAVPSAPATQAASPSSPAGVPGSPSFSRFNFRGAERSAVELVEVPILEDDPPPEARIHILNLKEDTCRWAIGDPGAEGFGFCGRKPLKGQPYCERHARMAYQPVQARRERRLA